MDDSKICDHKWVNAGVWHGKTPDGKPTGGQWFKCTVCGEKVNSMKKVRDMGGSYDPSAANAFGKSKAE